MAPEARQKRRLRLPDDVSGDAHHHVVEAAVLEVVLDPRAAGPRDRAVDDVELAVIGAANLVLTPVQLPLFRVQPVAIDRKDIVDDDLRPGVREPGEHLLGLAERPRAVAVDDDAHLDAVGQLPLEQRGHRHPDLALPPAEHEDVNRRAGRLDVGEDPGEEGRPLDPWLDGGRGRPGKFERRVVRSRSSARRERLGGGFRARGCHRSRGRRPTRMLCDREDVLVEEDEEAGRQQPGDREGFPQPTPAHARGSVAAHCTRTLHAVPPGVPGGRSSRRSQSLSRSSACSAPGRTTDL